MHDGRGDCRGMWVGGSSGVECVWVGEGVELSRLNAGTGSVSTTAITVWCGGGGGGRSFRGEGGGTGGG